MSQRKRKNAQQYIGQRFGRLVVKEYIDTPGRTQVLCQCDCGNEKIVKLIYLKNGDTKSCGCLNKEMATNMIPEIKPQLDKAIDKALIDGSNVHRLKQKPRQDSATGHKGVYPARNGKYRVSIGVSGKEITIGTFKTLEEAIQARKDAEIKYHQPIIDKYNHQ